MSRDSNLVTYNLGLNKKIIINKTVDRYLEGADEILSLSFRSRDISFNRRKQEKYYHNRGF